MWVLKLFRASGGSWNSSLDFLEKGTIFLMLHQNRPIKRATTNGVFEAFHGLWGIWDQQA